MITALEPVRENRLVDVAEQGERQHRQHSGRGVAGAPQGLAQLVFRICRNGYQQRQGVDPAKGDRRHDDEQDAGGR